ncbi:glucosaminidase domain-containing protein [Novosphingobium rosa]|uniref:glucosaminidase domain-containing protein n=1 Tax=Novosphingobium rosa TaxID=76978 RepID=UPI00083246CA|nr:glucosaminidase domain-containing protein [Novosphingobium rosa]
MQIIPQSIAASAIAAMKHWGSPASVGIGQWGFESGWGKKVSGKNNYGGITARVKGAVFPFVPGTPMEPATLCPTHENWQGERVPCKRWFKDFDTPDAFFDAHAKLLATSPLYAKARAKLPDVYAFVAIMGPIYATGEGYAETLASIIRTNNLTRFDNV